MIEELTNLLDNFPGPANQTRCFLHILNLVVKSIIQQFDLPKSKKTSDNEDEDDPTLDVAMAELLKLAVDIDLEEQITVSAGDDEVGDDDDEGRVDEHEEMTEDELKELAASMQPVQLLLTKLQKVAFAIKNSTTIILPRWFPILQDLELTELMIPRDVSTQWNLTFDMLDFTIEHITAINAITSNCDMKLRQSKLSEHKWDVACQLRDVLKVHIQFGLFYTSFYIIRYSRMQHSSFPEEHPALPPSYQPWTTLMNISPQLLSTTNTLW
ncbi:hypothetical protein L208DRAFT_1337857 [Tricholoma matsutake]|nr:hypothetical protein L208DRAFT_1337857 [Tricholoma matsutake 945]